MAAPPSPAQERLTLLVFAAMALHLVFLVDSLLDQVLRLPLEGDWHYIHELGRRVWAGDWATAYDVGPEDRLFWRYPPFALYAAALWALLPAVAAYWVLMGLQVLGVGVTLRQLPVSAPVLAVTAAFASAPFADVVGAGQFSGILLAVIASGCLLWARGQPLVGGLVLGLLATKPNWGLPFGLFALAVGEWRAAAGMLATTAGLLLCTAPLGLGIWSSFLEMSLRNDRILAAYDNSLMITLWGTLQGALPGVLARVAWWGGLGAMGWALVRVVRREDREMQLATVTLFAIAANPYASYYDALVLLFPGLVWARRADGSRWWWAIGGILAALWISTYAATKYHMLWAGERPPFALTGLLIAAWLVTLGGWRTRSAPGEHEVPVADPAA
ncbi:MAG: DUF2029 domain-containing protein [Myxococcales bacterium]|nr:DUF2029 domain-containing protein [Myxococcales bacterium]